MAFNSTIQDFFDEISDICFLSTLSEVDKDKKMVALKLEYARKFSTKDSNYFYFLGYAGYLAKDLRHETEAHFKEALRLDPENAFCQYYYAYFLFDSKRHGEAVKILEEIDLTYFEELGLALRIFKIKEAIACCSLFLDNCTERERIEKIDMFLSEYEEHESVEKDRYDDPINYPREIIKSLSETLDDLSNEFKPLVARLTCLMENEKLQKAYRSEYDRFNRFLSRSKSG